MDGYIISGHRINNNNNNNSNNNTNDNSNNKNYNISIINNMQVISFISWCSGTEL